MSADEEIRHARILIADDDNLNVVLLTRILQRDGYTRVTGVTDSRQIAGQVRQFEPDLLLLDLHMPHLDGFAVMSQLKPDLPTGFPVVLVTGEVDDETRRQAMDRGATEVLIKPYQLGTVLGVVDRLLRARLPGRGGLAG
jgi:putative two-component system response regulator